MARKSKYASVLNDTDKRAAVYRCGIYCRLSDEASWDSLQQNRKAAK